MRIISQKPLVLFWSKHPNAEIPLKHWFRVTKSALWTDFSQTRQTFPSADQVKIKGKALITVFNAGSGIRIITAIHYNRQMVFILRVLTHEEYEKESWKTTL